MTYADLKQEIFDLGFETEADFNEQKSIIFNSINRAMREITNRFPLIGEYKIAQNPIQNLLSNPLQNQDVKHYDGKNAITYSASGAKSLYFECSGTGKLVITDDNGERTVELASANDGIKPFKAYREFVNGNITLTFNGDYSYDIKNIAVYGELFSDILSDIPAYKQNVYYDFKELTAVNGIPVFIEFMPDPIFEGNFTDGKAYRKTQDYEIQKRHILVLNGFEKGQFTVFYKRNFVPFTETTAEDCTIEIDYDRQHLIALLASWYIWKDEEPTIAGECRNDYEDYMAQLLQATSPKVAQQEFVNAKGW